MKIYFGGLLELLLSLFVEETETVWKTINLKVNNEANVEKFP